MKLELKYIKNIENIDSFDIKLDKSDPSTSSIFKVVDGKIIKNEFLNNSLLNDLKERNVDDIIIQLNTALLDYLRTNFPENFPKPHGKQTVEELKKMVQDFDSLNKKSKKRRYYIFAEDIFEVVSINKQEMTILYEYNSKITLDALHKIEKLYGREYEIEYFESENGLLLFVPDTKQFKIKVDLIAILSYLDVNFWDKTGVKEAYEFYKEQQPKVVLFGNLPNNLMCKELFLNLKNYDPYMKYLNFNESPTGKEKRITAEMQIKEILHQPYVLEEMSEEASANLPLLPEENGKKLIDNMQQLAKAWSKNAYIEMAFSLYELSEKYNVAKYHHLLENIRKTVSKKQ